MCRAASILPPKLPRFLILACCLFALAALVAPARPGAQSGRHKSAPSASPTPSKVPGQRPRTVTQGPIANWPDPSAPRPNDTTNTSSTDAPSTGNTSGTETKGTSGATSPARIDAPTATSTPTGAPNAATGNPQAVDEDEVVRVNSNLVPVPASVIDMQGRAVVNLGVEDFELKVDGTVRPIGDVSRAETPVRMAVLFDNSSSLTAGRDFEKKAAVRFFRSVIRPIDQAALYSISTEPQLVLPLTGDVRALVRIVEHFPQPEGATSMFDAIAMAADYLRPHQGRKVLIIVSDGVDTTSRYDFDETLHRLLDADCQFFAVQTGNSDNTNLRDLVAERRLQEFAAQTGGAVYTPKGTGDLDTAFAQISADLAQQYILSYYPSDERRDGRFRTFSLRVVTRRDVRVRTRRGYYAPKG